MNITLAKIEALRPCQGRLDNYKKFYAEKEFTPVQFLGLKNITHDDKLWVAFRVLPDPALMRIAGLIAQSVLHIYEAQHPNDRRVRDCITVVLNPNATRAELDAARAAAGDAARAAARGAAGDAARAAARGAKEEEICTIILREWKKA
jgi:hypothetical protein